MHQILFRFCKSLKSTGELNSSHESKIKKKKNANTTIFPYSIYITVHSRLSYI